MEGKSLLIGEKEISQGDLISDISKETAYPLSWVSADGEESLHSSVFFLYSSKLPTMFLETASGSMEEIMERGNTLEAIFMEVVEDAGEDQCVGESGAL